MGSGAIIRVVIDLGLEQSEANSHASDLVLTALGQNSLSGLSEMLKSIAGAVHSYGCVLWRITPASQGPDSNLSSRRLFVVAEWLRDNRSFALHNLPLDSVTGMAVLSQKSQSVSDIWEDQRVFLGEQPFKLREGSQTMCSVPISFRDNVHGAVNLYRTESVPFNADEVRLVEELASLVPALYQTIQDKVSLGLIRSVNEIFREAEVRESETPLSKVEVSKVFQTICDRVADTFNCVETSTFLEDRLEASEQYRMTATTWTGGFKKSVYRKSIRDGLTGWVLAHSRSVRVFDLAHFESDKDSIRLEYPSITWNDSLHFSSDVRGVLNVESDDELPPLSFMAAPIVMGRKLLGVIRCSTATKGPYFFSNSEVELLELVAAQIAEYWNNWLSRRETQQENESWRSLVESVSELNTFAHNELTGETPNELRIFNEALRVASNVIKGAEIMDIRLVDESSQELYFAMTYGKAWDENKEDEIQEHKQRRFSLRGKPESAGARVFQTGQLYVIHNVRKDRFYSEAFPRTKRMMIAPISVEEVKFGVLDILGTEDGDFPKHAQEIAELLGHQLGLYHFLATTIRMLRQVEAELTRIIKELRQLQVQQAQTYEDLEHQLKSPIVQAYARAQAVLKQVPSEGKLRSNLQAIRGLCGRANRVAMSTGLFAKLAREEAIKPNLRRLSQDYLVKMLTDAAADNSMMTDPARNITFQVDRKTTDILRTIKVKADPDLLEQAVNNLLDNAAKYSFPNTMVKIRWGLAGKERFHISIVNKGLPIRSEDVQRCVNRGWRSSLAESATGEGSGIGLWIVDHIMRAHGGELIVVPTTAAALTEVKLILPASST